MFKFLKDRKKKDNKGFTLVELVIVIAILAILVGLLAPQYTKYVEKSRKAADATNLENMVKAVEVAAADASESIPAGTYTITIKQAAGDDNKGTTIAATGEGADATKVEAAIKEFINDSYSSTVTKSKKWKEVTVAAKDGSISAQIIVNSEGATTVTYTPEAIKDLSTQKAK